MFREESNEYGKKDSRNIRKLRRRVDSARQVLKLKTNNVNLHSCLRPLTEYSLTVLGLEVVGRFLITMSMNVGQQYPVEVLPTVARGLGSGAIHTLGYVSVFLSPYVVYLVSVACLFQC